MSLPRLLLRWITLSTLALCIAIGAAKAIGTVLPDDGLIVFSHYSEQRHTFEIGLFDVRTRTITHPIDHSGVNWNLRWSPDGSQFGFVSMDEQDCATIFVVDALGRTVQHIRDEVGFMAFEWSPDGSYIAYHTPRDGQEAIRVIELATGNRWTVILVNTLIGPYRRIESFNWSQDGQFIHLRLIHPEFRTYRIQALLPGDLELVLEYDWQTIAHPEGRYYLNFDRNGVSVWDNETQSSHFLTSQFDFGTEIIWSPDSLWLIFRQLNMEHELFIVNRDGTDARLLTTLYELTEHRPIIHWLPDSHHIATFARQPVTDTPQLCIIAVDSSDEQCFQFPYDIADFDWRP